MSEAVVKSHPASATLSVVESELDMTRRNLVNDLYSRYWGELCLYINKTFGAGPPEPEDVVQSAFAKFSTLETPQDIENPRAFLYRMAYNIAIDQRRGSERHERLLRLAPSFLDEEITDDRSPERVLLGNEELRVLEDVIMTLSERDRTFFLLNRLEGVSFAEIARRTNMSASNVRRIIEDIFERIQIAFKNMEHKRRKD